MSRLTVLFLLVSLFTLSTTKKKDKEKPFEGIRIRMNGPPLPLLLQTLTGGLMGRSGRQFNHLDAQSRSDFSMQSRDYGGYRQYGGFGQYRRGGDYGGGGQYGGDYGGGGQYGGGGYYGGGGGGYGGGYSENYYADPRRTGYHLGLGLGALKGLLIGAGSKALEAKTNAANYGGGYGGYGGGGGYGYNSVPKFNIHDGLMLLKGLLHGNKQAKLPSFALGKKLGVLQTKLLQRSGGILNTLLNAVGGNDYGQSSYGGGYGGGYSGGYADSYGGYDNGGYGGGGYARGDDGDFEGDFEGHWEGHEEMDRMGHEDFIRTPSTFIRGDHGGHNFDDGMYMPPLIGPMRTPLVTVDESD